MATTTRPVAGKEGRVISQSTVLTVNGWNLDWIADDLEVTNFESDGAEEGVIGNEVAVFTLQATWNLAQDPFNAEPTLKPGVLGPDDEDNPALILQVKKGGRQFAFPQIRILTARIVSSSRNKTAVTWEITGKSDGRWSEHPEPEPEPE